MQSPETGNKYAQTFRKVTLAFDAAAVALTGSFLPVLYGEVVWRNAVEGYNFFTKEIPASFNRGVSPHRGASQREAGGVGAA